MQSQSISPYDPDVLFMHYQAKSDPGGALDDRFSCAFTSGRGRVSHLLKSTPGVVTSASTYTDEMREAVVAACARAMKNDADDCELVAS